MDPLVGQDLSIAGKRAGLAGERSGLFMEQIRIIKEMRDRDIKAGRTGTDIRPRFMVWENVCFSGDTLITTESGFKRIDEIEVGEHVLTHSGRYMPVAKTYCTPAQKCISVNVQGSTPIICTENHPFLAIKVLKHGNDITGYSDPEYVCAKDITKDHRILTIKDTPEYSDDYISDADAWAVGRWLADGSVDLKRSNPRIFISCGDKKVPCAERCLSMIGESVYKNKPHKTATNFVFTSPRFYNLISECGIGAANKRVPGYVYKLPIEKQRFVLHGYLSGDGFERCRRKGSIEISANTVSRHLAYGIARLIRNVYGVTASIFITGRKDGKIGNRVIHSNHDVYSIHTTVSDYNKKYCEYGSYIMHRVKSIEPISGTQDVYNLSVLEDNTYVANGFVVHNCGALSSNGGRDFAAVLEETIRVVEPEAPNISPLDYDWTLSGCFVGKQWSVAWRVLDAQFWGVPQRRRRIALVADFGGQCAQEILFERSRSERNSESGEEERKGTSGDASDSFRAASGIFGELGFGWWDPRGRDLSSSCHETEGSGFVVSDTVAIEGNGSRESHQGDGYSETDTMYTLNTVEQHSVCYSIPAFNSGGMLSANPNTGYNPNEVARTLDTMGGDPTGYQGGIAVVQAAPDKRNTGGIQCLNPEDPQSARIYHPDGVYHSLNANSSGGLSRDGVIQPVCLESNQNHATITDSGVSPTLSASMGLGGGYVPMITADESTVRAAGFCPEQSGDTRSIGYEEEVAPTLRAGVVPGTVYPDVARTLTARHDSSPCIDRGPDFVVYESHDQDARYTPLGETCSTVSAKYGTGGGNAPMVVSCGNGQSNTIDHPIEELARTLDCMHDPQIICAAVDCRNGTESEATKEALQAKENGGTPLNYNNVVRQNYIVRRLTPLEAERLQGIPDGWTDIGEWIDSKGKKHRPADAPRYKAIGNGIAVPPWLWVLSRLNQYCGEDKTMASLFDGISTYPLIWSFLNGKECCSWSSEVDEFCIALSKIRFPDTDE